MSEHSKLNCKIHNNIPASCISSTSAACSRFSEFCRISSTNQQDVPYHINTRIQKTSGDSSCLYLSYYEKIYSKLEDLK